MKNTMKNNTEEKIQKRFFILEKVQKADPVLMSDRSFYSEACEIFAKACDRDNFLL